MSILLRILKFKSHHTPQINISLATESLKWRPSPSRSNTKLDLIVFSRGQHLRWLIQIIWRSSYEERITISGITHRKSMSMNAIHNPSLEPGSCVPRSSHAQSSRESMPSHLKRPGAIYFSFSSHCWHTVIEGPCCLATKPRQAFFQFSVRGRLRPSSSLEEWLKGHFTPALSDRAKIVFSENYKECVCLHVCV